MSYSFIERAPTVAAVMDQVAAKLDEIVASQPSHATDRAVTFDAINAVADVVGDAPEGEVVQLSVSGSVMTRDDKPYSISVSINATHTIAAPGGV